MWRLPFCADNLEPRTRTNPHLQPLRSQLYLQEIPKSSGDEDDMIRALERTLVRLGGLVLPEGTVEIEPEVSYSYDEPNEGARAGHPRLGADVPARPTLGDASRSACSLRDLRPAIQVSEVQRTWAISSLVWQSG